MNTPGLLRNWRALADAVEVIAARADHAELHHRLAALARVAPAQWLADPAATAEGLAAFRETLQREGLAALETSLCPTEAEQAFVRWAVATVRVLFAMAAEVAETACARSAGHPHALARAGAAMGVALALAGDGVKWQAFAEVSRSAEAMARAHRAFAAAENAGLDALAIDLDADGERLAIPLAGLYARVLLLEIVASGQLGRQQVEIADSWILRMASEITLARDRGGAAKPFWVDLASATALRVGGQPVGPGVRFLRLEALPGFLATVVRAFQSGCIYPGGGAAARFRLEEHVAVLDFIQGYFRRLMEPGPLRRGGRKGMGDVRVEAFLGIGDLVSHALRAGPRAPCRANDSGGGRASSRNGGFEFELELEHRWLRLHDASAGGLGLIAAPGEHADIAVGDLLGIDEPSGTLAIGEVVRRRVEDEPGQSRIGLRTLTRAARAVTLHRLAEDGGRAAREVDAIFVPAGGPGWSGETLLLGSPAFSPHASYEARFPDAAYLVRLGPVRRRGRGWVATGWEVHAKRVPEDSAPALAA